MTNLTADSKALLNWLLDEGAGNDFYENDCCYLWDCDLTPAQVGNLTDLKKKGLVSTQDERSGANPGFWVLFSDEAMTYHYNRLGSMDALLVEAFDTPAEPKPAPSAEEQEARRQMESVTDDPQMVEKLMAVWRDHNGVA
jgi:hypothetical protein